MGITQVVVQEYGGYCLGWAKEASFPEVHLAAFVNDIQGCGNIGKIVLDVK